MTALDQVLEAYLASVDCQQIVTPFLTKSRKGRIFHNTVFLNQPLEQARSLLVRAKAQLDDLTTVALVSVFVVGWDSAGQCILGWSHCSLLVQSVTGRDPNRVPHHDLGWR